MPRKPRIEIPGYYHIVNRGVERRVVFKDNGDYAYFIELLYHHSKNYHITIHITALTKHPSGRRREGNLQAKKSLN